MMVPSGCLRCKPMTVRVLHYLHVQPHRHRHPYPQPYRHRFLRNPSHRAMTQRSLCRTDRLYHHHDGQRFINERSPHTILHQVVEYRNEPSLPLLCCSYRPSFSELPLPATPLVHFVRCGNHDFQHVRIHQRINNGTLRCDVSDPTGIGDSIRDDRLYSHERYHDRF